jgi:mxaJ protein
VPFVVTPVDTDAANQNLPLSFDIALGVRQGDDSLKRQLDAELERRRIEIRDLLISFGIPQLNLPQARIAGYRICDFPGSFWQASV